MSKILYFLHDELGFLLLAQSLDEENLVSFFIVGPEGFIESFFVALDNCIRSGNDGLGRTVVLLQLDHYGSWEILLKREDILNIGTPPTVYPLPVISDY